MDSGIDEPIYLHSHIDPIIISLIMICGILVNWKFLNNMKDDDRERGPNSNGLLIRDIMGTHAKTQMIAWPTLWVIFWMLHVDVPFPDWLQPCFCYIKLFAYIFRIYFAFNSLAVAAMRYIFIVHNSCITSFGIIKTKTILYYGSLFVPLMIAIMSECTIDVPADLGGKAFDLCQHSKHNDPMSSNFTGNASKTFSSPIFILFHRYVPNNAVYLFGLFTKVCLWIIFGNLLEGVFFWKTFGYISR